MSEIIGRQLEVGLAVEAVRGVAQATPEAWLKNTTAHIIDMAEIKEDDSHHGKIEDQDGRRVVKKWVEGDLEGIVGVNVLGYFLYNLYGADTDTLVSGSVYSHIFALAQSIVHPSLSLVAKDGGVQQLVFNNCMISKFELNAVVDDYLRYKASFTGKTSAANASSPSYPTDYDFIGKDIVIKIADTEAGLAGATALSVKELGISFDTGLINDFVLGSYNPDDLYNAKMSIEGTIKKNFIDNTFKALYQSDTYKYMSITITSANAITGVLYPTITIILNKVGIISWDRSGGADELVVEDIGFKAYYNSSDAEQSTITLQNSTAEYDVPISA